SGGVVVLTGKGYGSTNFLSIDRSGEVLVDRVIQVEGPTDQLVTVYRGVERESYSCLPICQRRITLGDGETYFKSTMDQAGSLSRPARGAGARPNYFHRHAGTRRRRRAGPRFLSAPIRIVRYGLTASLFG